MIGEEIIVPLLGSNSTICNMWLKNSNGVELLLCSIHMSSKFSLDFVSGIHTISPKRYTHFSMEMVCGDESNYTYIDEYFGFIVHKTNSHSFLFFFFCFFLSSFHFACCSRFNIFR